MIFLLKQNLTTQVLLTHELFKNQEMILTKHVSQSNPHHTHQLPKHKLTTKKAPFLFLNISSMSHGHGCRKITITPLTIRS